MRIKMLRTQTVQLDKRNSRNYVFDWEGEVDDDLALAWIATGAAVSVAAPATAPILTEQETAVLKAAAQAALAMAQDAANEEAHGEQTDGQDADEGGEDVSVGDLDTGDDATGDAEAGGDEERGEVEADPEGQDPAELIRALSKDDLHALAKSRGVRVVARSRADIEADLIAQAEQDRA